MCKISCAAFERLKWRKSVFRAARRISEVLAEEFAADPDWVDSRAPRFLVNYVLFDVLRVMNAPQSLAEESEESFDSAFADYEVVGEELRGDYLSLCESLNRIETRTTEVRKPEARACGLSCSSCGKNIMENESMWSVNVKQETCDRNVLTVVRSDIVLVFCGECADSRNFASLHVPEEVLSRNNCTRSLGCPNSEGSSWIE